MSKWLKKPFTDDINEVPGVSFNSNKDKLLSTNESDDSISNALQLLGMYLFFRGKDVDRVENANLFNNHLRSRGITKQRDTIVQAVGEKANTLIPGTYEASDYEKKIIP